MIVTDPLSPIHCKVEPQWINLVCPAHPTDTQLHSDEGNLDAKPMPQTCCASQTIPEPS